MIIDSHAHIYSEDLETYPTIEDPLRPPAGTGTPAGLQEAMGSCGVDRAMLVQTTTFYEWDNTFVRDVGSASDDWARSVVTLDPEDPHSPDILFALYERANARALRTYPVGRQDYDHPGNRRLISAARDLGITVNALLGELRSAGELAKILADFPDCSFVLDHCLALDIGPHFDAKLQRVIELASFPNLHAKLTFLPTGTREDFPFPDMHGACRRIIDAYGPDRCVWGSDYPTELWCPNVTYSQHLELFQQHLDLSESEQQAILGGTAERLWFA